MEISIIKENIPKSIIIELLVLPINILVLQHRGLAKTKCLHFLLLDAEMKIYTLTKYKP